MTDVRTFPKIELHLHLDCSLSYEAVSRLVPGVTREQYNQDYVAPSRCPNLTEYLKRSVVGFRVMQTPEALALVTEDVFQQLAADGVIYAELRFAPLLHLLKGLGPEQVVEIVDRATEKMIAQTGIEARLILCTLRHFTEAQSMETVQMVEKFRGSRVVALDLAGDEAGFPLDAHVGAYRYAKEHGLFHTAHAGEGAGPESVWETLRTLAPARIGHGTRSSEDPQLVEHLRREKIHLELCPSANVQIIPTICDWENHPIDRLYRAGVRLNVNTDTRMLTPTNLVREYEGVQRVFGWGRDEFLRTNLMAVEAAFVDNEVKGRLKERLTTGYHDEETPLRQPA